MCTILSKLLYPHPIQCSCCKMFGWEKSRCGTCEIDHYEGDVECLVEENGQGAKPCNWGGAPEAKSLECPIWVKETEVVKIREVERVSYVKVVKRAERSNITEGVCLGAHKSNLFVFIL